MKALWFLPLTFTGGVEAFAIFAPYLLAMLCVMYFARAKQRRQPVCARAARSNASSDYLCPSLA